MGVRGHLCALRPLHSPGHAAGVVVGGRGGAVADGRYARVRGLHDRQHRREPVEAHAHDAPGRGRRIGHQHRTELRADPRLRSGGCGHIHRGRVSRGARGRLAERTDRVPGALPLVTRDPHRRCHRTAGCSVGYPRASHRHRRSGTAGRVVHRLSTAPDRGGSTDPGGAQAHAGDGADGAPPAAANGAPGCRAGRRGGLR